LRQPSEAHKQQYEMCFAKSFGWYESDDCVFIAMEYFPLGDLQSYLSSPLSEKEAKQIASQILEGLSFMHDNGFAHRDLKPTVSLLVDLHNYGFISVLRHLIIPENYRTFS
jgi:serine/threonine protein kinase